MMDEWLDFLRCPNTGFKLELDGSGNLVTADGRYQYSVSFGIPDLRVFEPPYMSREEEIKIAGELYDAAKTKNYNQLVEYFESVLLGDRPREVIDKGIAHRLKLRERSPNRLKNILSEGSALIPYGALLDLGCGSGEAVAELINFGAQSVIGVDISLTELVLARKLLDEAGIDVCLVAACAEAMPFCNEYFDFVYSPDVIEHVSNQDLYLNEINRILQQNGIALLNSPNRYSLVCPEPHVGIWGLTYLPRPWVDPVCRALGKGAYVGKRLLSKVELKRLLSKNFNNFQLISRLANPQSNSWIGKLYYSLSPWSEKIFSYVADQHIVVAKK